MSSASRPGLTAAGVWASLVVATGTAVGIALFVQGRFEADVVLFVLAAIAYSFLGLLMVARQPGNRVAWLLFAVATWVAVTGLTELRGVSDDVPPDPVAPWDVLAIMWGNVGYFVGLLFPLLLFLYIFPTGQFLTRRWSWAGWVVGVISLLAIASQVFAEQVGPDGADWTVPNPIGFLEASSLDEGVLGAVFGVGFVVVGLGAIPAIIVRYRRSEAVVRTQVKWVVYAMVLMVGSLILTSTFGTVVLPDWADLLAFVVLMLAVPVSVTVAIIRYQLYEIDRIISRTISYTLVLGLLAAAFIGMVAVVGSFIPSDNPVVVAASTLAVAALFNPLRRRVQEAVDRRFNRSGYRAEVVSEKFAAKLREPLSTQQITALWSQAVEEAMHPQATGIWLKEKLSKSAP